MSGRLTSVHSRITRVKDSKEKDRVYAHPQSQIVDFAFNESVANVFPDMIRRSVPGYDNMISLTGLVAQQYAIADSRVYDLGCSLGATTLAMRHHIEQPVQRIVAVDNAYAMTLRCRESVALVKNGPAVDVVCADIRHVRIERASVVVLNFTLQFIEPAQRLALLKTTYKGMLPGGVLLLSEKICFADEAQQQRMEQLHFAFKKANGYSELEISQKRNALENVLLPDTLTVHQQRLQQAGFRHSELWFRCFNFVSLLAYK